MVILKIKTRPSMASLANLNINQTLQCWVTNTPDHHRGPRNLSWFSRQESPYEAGYDSICQPPKKVKERHRQLGNYKGFACSITVYWVHTKLGIPIPFKVLLDFHLMFKSRKTSENRVKRIISLCCFYLLCKKRQTNSINNSIEQNFHWTKKITSASSTSGHHMIRSKINAV